MKIKPIHAVVVEDEHLSRHRLCRLIREDGRIKLIGEYENAEELFSSDELNTADILFLDINLPGMNGIDLAKKLNEKQLVIYTTAYPQYAVDAFSVNASDYLVKPISQEDVSKSIKRALSILKLNFFYDKNKNPKYIFIKHGLNNIKIYHQDIYCIKSDNNHVKIHTHEHEYLIKTSLQSLEETFNGDDFMRTHRTCIVNINKIHKIIPSGSTKVAVLDNQTIAPLSRGFWSKYSHLLNDL